MSQSPTALPECYYSLRFPHLLSAKTPIPVASPSTCRCGVIDCIDCAGAFQIWFYEAATRAMAPWGSDLSFVMLTRSLNSTQLETATPRPFLLLAKECRDLLDRAPFGSVPFLGAVDLQLDVSEKGVETSTIIAKLLAPRLPSVPDIGVSGYRIYIEPVAAIGDVFFRFAQPCPVIWANEQFRLKQQRLRRPLLSRQCVSSTSRFLGSSLHFDRLVLKQFQLDGLDFVMADKLAPVVNLAAYRVNRRLPVKDSKDE